LLILANTWVVIVILILLINLTSFLFREKYKAVNYKPKVTVVIAIWNESPRIRKCVESILNSDYPKNKFNILVTGGGEDNTVEVCKKLESEGKINFMPEYKRGGKWTALNKAIEKVETELIAFTDGDYVVDKSWLSELVKNSSGVDIVVGSIWTTTERTFSSKMYVVYHAFFDTLFSAVSRIFGSTRFMGQNSLFKRHVFDKLLFKKSQIEDMRLGFEAYKMGFKVRQVYQAKTYSAVPASIRDFRVELVRVFEGIYNELLREGNMFAIASFVFTILSFVLLPFTFYNLFKFDYMTWSLSLVAMVLFMINCICIQLKFKRKMLKYAIYTVPFAVTLLLSSLEAMLRLLFKKNIGWPTLNKIVD